MGICSYQFLPSCRKDFKQEFTRKSESTDAQDRQREGSSRENTMMLLEPRTLEDLRCLCSCPVPSSPVSSLLPLCLDDLGTRGGCDMILKQYFLKGLKLTSRTGGGLAKQFPVSRWLF